MKKIILEMRNSVKYHWGTSIILLAIMLFSLAPGIGAQGYFTIHFYRTNNYGESKFDMDIMMDGKLATSIRKGSRITYTALYGEKIQISAKNRICNTRPIFIEPRKGSVHYVKVDGNTCFLKEFSEDIGERAFYNPNDFDYPVAELRDPRVTDEMMKQQELQAYQPGNDRNGRDNDKLEDNYRPPQREQGTTSGTKLVTGDYYALIMGVNDYQDQTITDLDNPLRDARKLYEVLNLYYTFEKDNMILLENPTRAKIIETMDELSVKVSEDDNLLVFYAGHGHWDEEKELGYWLPSDSRSFSSANWLRNSTLQDYIATIPSRHTLLIADACFSGGIFKTRRAFANAPMSVSKLHELPSRKGMTSGTLMEVPDESVFIQFLIKRLIDNEEKFISSEKLFASFREAVLNNSPNVPQFGTIQNAGDEGGDFIFIRKEQVNFREP